MKTSLQSSEIHARRSSFLRQVTADDNNWFERPFGWWFRLTMPSRVEKGGRLIQRDAVRRARLLSTIGLFYLAFLLLVLPAAFFASRVSLYSILFSGVIVAAILIMNRQGKIKLGSILIVLVFECSLLLSIIMSNPLDLTDMPLYDIFVIGELIAVSLLTIRSVFVLAGINSAFIVGDLLFQSHTQVLEAALQTQLILLIVRPICIQFAVITVLSLWVHNTFKANSRANRAEMIATIEHTLAAQHTIAEHEKQELESSIQQLIQAHVDATNKQLNARIPYPPAKVLWPLVGVFNSLWIRLQHSQYNEAELLQLKLAIAELSEAVQHASLTPQLPLELKRSGTDIDLLAISVKKLHDAAREPGFLHTRRDTHLNSLDLYH